MMTEQQEDIKMSKSVKIMVALLAMTLLAVPVFAATLQDALKEGKVSGEFIYYFLKGSDADTYSLNGVRNRDSSAVVSRLGYKSGNFRGLTLGTTFQASHDLRNHDAADAAPDGPSDDRLSISGANLLELYLAYSFADSEIKVGRQIIHSPLVNNDDLVYPMFDSFDAAVFTTTLVPKTMLQAMVIKQWNQRDTESETHFGDPLFSLFAVNNSIENLTLLGQYLTTSEDDFNTGNGANDMPTIVMDGWDEYLLQATYRLPISHPVTLGVQYGAASFDEAGQNDTFFYGVKATTEVRKFQLAASYVKIDEDNSLPSSFGHVPNSVTYNNMWILDLPFAGIESVILSAGYDLGNIGIKGLKATLSYATISQDEDSQIEGVEPYLDGASEVDLTLNYAFQGSLQGLSATAWMGAVMDAPGTGPNANGDEDMQHIRFCLKYAF